MARIAIVGTRQSGKTVLMTLLAKRYQNRNGDQAFLKTMTPQTMAFTEKNWHQLTVAQDWPPITPPGELLALHWALECQGSSHDIHLVDFDGESFLHVFGKHNLADPNQRQQLAAHPLFGPLLAYLDQADVIVLLVNLRDFVNAPAAPGGMDLMLQNQWALRGALDYVRPRVGNRIACVFTQTDQYPELVDGRGSWEKVMREHLPATQIADLYADIHYLGVAAVSQVEVRTIAGKPVPMPAAGFQSTNLETLMDFLVRNSKKEASDEERVGPSTLTQHEFNDGQRAVPTTCDYKPTNSSVAGPKGNAWSNHDIGGIIRGSIRGSIGGNIGGIIFGIIGGIIGRSIGGIIGVSFGWLLARPITDPMIWSIGLDIGLSIGWFFGFIIGGIIGGGIGCKIGLAIGGPVGPKGNAESSGRIFVFIGGIIGGGIGGIIGRSIGLAGSSSTGESNVNRPH